MQQWPEGDAIQAPHIHAPRQRQTQEQGHARPQLQGHAPHQAQKELPAQGGKHVQSQLSNLKLCDLSAIKREMKAGTSV